MAQIDPLHLQSLRQVLAIQAWRALEVIHDIREDGDANGFVSRKGVESVYGNNWVHNKSKREKGKVKNLLALALMTGNETGIGRKYFLSLHELS